VGLMQRIRQRRNRSLAGPVGHATEGVAQWWRRCRFEQMEPRQLLAVNVLPIQIGGVYYEDAGGDDAVADRFEVTFSGGAPGTQLTELIIQTDKNSDGDRDEGECFFDTKLGGAGVFGAIGLSILEHDGFTVTGMWVDDGGDTLRLTFSGFDAGETLVFSVDVDEQGYLDASNLAEGNEFEGSRLVGTFAADHYETVSGVDIFRDYYDAKLVASGLPLPPDDYVPPPAQSLSNRTAGAIFSLTQTPLPITLSGTVFEDDNLTNTQNPGEDGIPGVHVALLELIDGEYVATGMTDVTDSAGHYEFTGLLPGTYRVVETQPEGYLSVGATAGTVGETTRGTVLTSDIITGIALEGGDDSVHNDFAEVRPVALSGHVYHDADDSGTFDGDEDGIKNALVQVESLATHEVISLHSDAQGYWHVENLMPGEYRVTEVTPEGYLDGKDSHGTAGGTAHNPGDLIDGIVLAAGKSGENYDFGELKPGGLCGYVYVDTNNNGTRDEGEPGIPNVTVTLLDAEGNPVGDPALTDENGHYSFAALVPGTYGIVETHPQAYLDGLDEHGTLGGVAHNPGDLIDQIVVGSGQRGMENNFGELRPARLQGTVFVDLDDDLMPGEGETRLAGVTIYLLDSTGKRIDLTTTDANGQYLFDRLMPGAYGLEEIQPQGYLDGNEKVGSAGGVLAGNDLMSQITLAQGDKGVDYNFCEVVPASLSGYVFQDGPVIQLQPFESMPDIGDIRDGKFTPDDKPIAGVVLQLRYASGQAVVDSSGHPLTATTNKNGYYEFTGLRPGRYIIVETQPTGYIDGVDTAGSLGGIALNSKSFAGIEIPEAIKGATSDAIVAIPLTSGAGGVSYNFSEVRVEQSPWYPPTPPPRPSEPLREVVFTSYPSPTRAPAGPPVPIAYATAPFYGGSGLPMTYTWHLSVINAGQPRRLRETDDQVAVQENVYFNPVSWEGSSLRDGQWVVADNNGQVEYNYQFGVSDGTPVVGDFNGDGIDEIGVFVDGQWFLDVNGNGVWDEGDLWAKLGDGDDMPVTGDWDGDGKVDIGIFGRSWLGDPRALRREAGLPDRQNEPNGRYKNLPPDPQQAPEEVRTLKRTAEGRLRADVIDHVFEFGRPGDKAIAGDWNGDGISSVGIYRNGAWFLDMDGNGRWSDADLYFEFGSRDDRPVVGDFNRDGIDDVGIYRDGKWILDTNGNHEIDAQDKVLSLGGPDDVPIVGDFDGDGVDQIGVYRGGPTPDRQASAD